MFEDPRVHHRLLNIRVPEAQEVADFLRKFPGNQIVLASCTFPLAAQIAKLAPESKFCVETSKLEGPVQCVQRMVETIGAERVLLGTAMPFMNPAGALMAAQQPEIAAEAKTAILGGNAERIFK
jgi:predicted TIM-barrel fold metal-dependent hydrolase